MKKIIVRISNETQAYEEDVTQDIIEHFEECQSNGENKWLENITFDHYTRHIKECLLDPHILDKYKKCDKNAHFIFGWMEVFSQGDNITDWMRDTTSLFIEVKK